MVSQWVLFCSSMLGCLILHSHIIQVTSLPFVFDDIRDTEGIIHKAPPSKKYDFPNPISWSQQYKRAAAGKRGFSFPVPNSWSSDYKRGDFTFSLPGYWSHRRVVSPKGSFKKRGASVVTADQPLHDLKLCDDLAGLKDTLNVARKAIARLQDDCAMRDLSLELCLTAEETDLLKELYVTSKRGAEELGWCLAESDIIL